MESLGAILDTLMTLTLQVPRLHGWSLQQAIGGAVTAAGGAVLAILQLFALDSDTATYLGSAGAGAIITGALAAGNAYRRQVNEDRQAERDYKLKLREIELKERAESRKREIENAAIGEIVDYMREMRRLYREAREKHRGLPVAPDLPDLPDAFRQIARQLDPTGRKGYPTINAPPPPPEVKPGA